MKDSLSQNTILWEVVGDLAGTFLISVEAFAVIGAMIWATLSTAGLTQIAGWSGGIIGGVAGVLVAIWFFRQATEQRGSKKGEVPAEFE